ncbi:hypothetical protein ACOME3_002970 [Neoechinorhynchus agilis]
MMPHMGLELNPSKSQLLIKTSSVVVKTTLRETFYKYFDQEAVASPKKLTILGYTFIANFSPTPDLTKFKRLLKTGGSFIHEDVRLNSGSDSKAPFLLLYEIYLTLGRALPSGPTEAIYGLTLKGNNYKWQAYSKTEPKLIAND